MTREKIERHWSPPLTPPTQTMSQYQRGTKVEFVGKPPGRPDQDSSAKHYVDKYGVQVGDYGTVVRVKNGWWRVSFTRQDGTRAVAVPMRLDDIKKRKLDDDVEDELVKRLKRLTTGESERLTQFDVVTDDREVLDKIIEEERVARDQKHLTNEDTTAEPPMNENFGFDEQPAVVADMKKEIEKLLRTRSVHALLGIEISAARGRYGWRRRMLYDKVQQGVLSLEQMFQEEERAAIADERADAAKEAKLKAELEEVKLQLISARTLIQLKDKTIAQLRGEPTFESWGDWVVA